MSVILKSGNLFDTDLRHLGHGVNTVGVMGAGIAVEFKRRYPEMFEDYADTCLEGFLRPGSVHIFRGEHGDTVYNIASQQKPGADARLEWLASGLDAALAAASEVNAEGLAIPRIGCGIGGLEWDDVLPLIEAAAEKHNTTVEVWTL